MAAISINIITKDDPTATLECLASVYEKLYQAGDEAVIVDTGSSEDNLRALEEGLSEFENARLVKKNLTVDFAPYVAKWLPEFEETFREYYGDTNLLANFAQAREIAREESKNQICFWIDSDDVIEEEIPGSLRSALERCMGEDRDENEDSDALFLDYKYAFDKDGVCITTLRRERFFFRDTYHWVGRCHETAIPKPTAPVKRCAFYAELNAAIRHTEHRKPSPLSDIRNYVILRRQYEEEDEIQDPRTIFYLANAARGLRHFEEAIKLYREFDRVSGSADDRYAAHYYIAGIYFDPEIRRPLDAITEYQTCLEIQPHDPRSYFGLSRAYGALCKWKECLYWYNLGCKQRIPDTQVFSYDPTHVDYHPHVIAAYGAKELNEMDLAREYAERAIRARPQVETSKHLYEDVRAASNGKKLTGAVTTVLSFLKNGGPNALRVGREICNELVAVPPDLEALGVSAVESPDPRAPRPSLAIFCGQTGEDWGPDSRETGIGGSEKMVLLLTEILQRDGPWNVSVYASVPVNQRGVDEETGVRWCHWSEFDNSVERDVLVAWRGKDHVLRDCPARLRVIWLHDVQHASHYTTPILEAADFVQFQSRYHLEPVADVIPKEKVWIARNAIEGYLTGHCAERNPKQVIYMSSPDRGLTTACKIVEEARKVDPEIHLVAAYGITPWARKAYSSNGHMFLPDVGHEISTDLYEREMFAALDRAGAKMLHRISFKQVYELLVTSGVWLYPTRFPEISCMAAMEAQAFGVVPLCTRFGALEETILPHTDTVSSPLPLLAETGEPSETYIQESAQLLLKAVQVPSDDPRRLAMAKAAWEAYNVDDLAAQWIEKLGSSNKVEPRVDCPSSLSRGGSK